MNMTLTMPRFPDFPVKFTGHNLPKKVVALLTFGNAGTYRIAPDSVAFERQPQNRTGTNELKPGAVGRKVDFRPPMRWGLNE